jgi:hypothetical protein
MHGRADDDLEKLALARLGIRSRVVRLLATDAS